MKAVCFWPSVFLCSTVIWNSIVLTVQTSQPCGEENGGGICPEGNTCCLLSDGRGSGCIPSDMGALNAVCCDDGETGCAVGYQCVQERFIINNKDNGGKSNLQKNFCVNHSGKDDPLVQRMPRYRLCHTDEIRTVHGLRVEAIERKERENREELVAELAYYSSHGPIEQLPHNLDWDLIFVLVHGSGRNADDYFCSGTAMVELQSRYDNVLLIAPLFYGEHDPRPINHPFLYWEDSGSGPWRYGADALGPAAISSYAAMDAMMDSIRRHVPNLPHIVMAGHSAGGQFVQRWTLLTDRWESQRMHAVVANPSSYAYLTPLRFVDGVWKVPSISDNTSCPHYNQWEWGLDDGGPIEVPYRKSVANNGTELVERFLLHRKVVYLAGGADRCNVSGMDRTGWCYSHGLETECVDELQGPNRRKRSRRYFQSLQRLPITRSAGSRGPPSHVRYLVPGVGHDHALMFQSEVGLHALFEAFQNEEKEEPRETGLSTRFDWDVDIPS